MRDYQTSTVDGAAGFERCRADVDYDPIDYDPEPEYRCSCGGWKCDPQFAPALCPRCGAPVEINQTEGDER